MACLKFSLIFVVFAYAINLHAREDDRPQDITPKQQDDAVLSITLSYIAKGTVFAIVDSETDQEKAVFVDRNTAPILQITVKI